MYCNSCGAKLPDGAKYCSSCGSAVVDGADSAHCHTSEAVVPSKNSQGLYASLIAFRRTTLKAVPTFVLVIAAIIATTGIAYAVFRVANDYIIPAFVSQEADQQSKNDSAVNGGLSSDGRLNAKSTESSEVNDSDSQADADSSSQSANASQPDQGSEAQADSNLGTTSKLEKDQQVQGGSQSGSVATNSSQQAGGQTNDVPVNSNTSGDNDTYTYQSSYGFSVELPKPWKDAIVPDEQGHESGIFHVDFYYKDFRDMPLWRVDGMANPDGTSDVSASAPRGDRAARELWEIAHGGSSSSPTMTKEDWVSYLKLATGDGIAVQEVESKESADAAAEAGDRAAQSFYEKSLKPTLKMNGSAK